MNKPGRSKADARKTYRQYVQSGVEEGRRDDLRGGGLVRSLGGWSQVISLRKSKERAVCDERILGRNEFVERIIGEADNRIKCQLSINERKIKANRRIIEVCKKENLNIEELKGGSRRNGIPKVRAQLAKALVKDYGLTLAETARQLGVSTSAISKIFVRRICGFQIVKWGTLINI